jgi:tRNA-specific 2-thiouridylase
VPAADGRPRYVLDLSPVSNTVTVGPRESLAVWRIEGVRPRWTQAPRHTAWRGLVQLRAHGVPVVAHATASEERVEMILESPVAGVAPGQAAVLYDGSRVVGSSTVAATNA